MPVLTAGTIAILKTIGPILVYQTSRVGIQGFLNRMSDALGGRKRKEQLLLFKQQLDGEMLRQNKMMELQNNMVIQKLCHEYRMEEALAQFENTKELHLMDHSLRVEEINVQANNARILQLLNHSLKMEEAESFFQRQLDLKYDETMWPLRTPFQHFSLKRCMSENDVIPIRVFMAKTGKKSKYTDGMEEEIKNAISGFIHKYTDCDTHPVMSHIGEWKEKDSRQDDAFIMALWNGLRGQPVIVVNPMYQEGKDCLLIRISQWGYSSKEIKPSTNEILPLPFGKLYGMLIKDETEKYVELGLPVSSTELKKNIDLLEQEKCLREKNVPEEAFERLLSRYVLAEEIKQEVLNRLTSTLGEVINTIVGLYIDVYYLVEYGLPPRLMDTLSFVYPDSNISVALLRQYRAVLVGLCVSNYQRDNLPMNYLKVIDAFVKVGDLSDELKKELVEMVCEAVAIWGNRIRELERIPQTLSECIDIINDRKSDTADHQFILYVKDILADLDFSDELGEWCEVREDDRIREDFSCAFSSSTVSSSKDQRLPSNQLVEMIKVEGGTFTRGKQQITLSTFCIGKYPVTQRQWKAVMGGKNPSHFPGDNNPVEQISWFQAIEFCNKLSESEGFDACYLVRDKTVTIIDEAVGYRLPTEAEWEFAARGGTLNENFTYSGSDDLDKVGWYTENSGGQTRAVGYKKSPNGLGLYDMSGNVWEWCWDWYGDYFSSNQTDLVGWPSGSNRVDRGGSWCHTAGSCAVSYRDYFTPDYSCNYLGFRLAFACSSK